MASYAALLDACVLVPVALADTLLRLAEAHLYRPVWSQRILAEALEAIVEIHPEIPSERLQHRFAAMDQAFEGACAEGWELIEKALKLPDPNDRHVVTAAIVGGADAIVTANVADYPSNVVGDFGLEVIHPDDFLLDQLQAEQP